MFYRYEIMRQGNEEVLYLYLTMKYEFSKELSFQSNEDLGRRTNHFIQANHIPFHGNKVFLVIDDMVVKSIDLSKVSFSSQYSNYYTAEVFLVHIELDDHSLCEITLKEYLLGILLSKYMDSIHDEVLKSICVLYNTYAYKMMKEEGKISADNVFAIYKPSSYYKVNMKNYDTIRIKLESIIQQVDSMFLRYKDNYILPFVHYSNSGKTLKNKKYPYLSSVKSLWDLTSPYYIEANDFSYEELSNKFQMTITKDSNISIYEKDESKKIMINKKVFQIEEFKSLLRLKSSNIYIIFYQNYLRILTSGWGNDLGLSIYGANEIASNGGKFYQILQYYFPKAQLFLYKKELSS